MHPTAVSQKIDFVLIKNKTRLNYYYSYKTRRQFAAGGCIVMSYAPRRHTADYVVIYYSQ